VHIYQFPTWSPDNQRIAFVGIYSLSGQASGGDLYIANLDGKNRKDLYHVDGQVPLYFYWSPDSRNITLLTEDLAATSLILELVPVNGGSPRTVAKGDSIFWAWSPDNQSILVHTAVSASSTPQSTVAVWDLKNPGDANPLDLTLTDFQAPAWSPAGTEILTAIRKDGRQALVTTDHNGGNQKVVDTYSGSVAFGWSPDGKKIAYLSGAGTEQNSYDTLTIIDPKNPKAKNVILEDSVMAFFWSPDSRKLVYFTSEGQIPSSSSSSGSQTLVKLTIFDSQTAKTLKLGEFMPTHSFQNFMTVFDQFQHSTTVWSPDSHNLVLPGYDNNGIPQLYVIEAAGNLQRRLVTSGYLGVWSWK
jgi:Tol biopolymer transport system component